MKIITIQEAKELGLKRYFTGEPCTHGHVSERLVSCNGCLECNAERNRKWREENKERFAEIKRKSYEKNKDKEIERARKYREKNKEKIAEKRRKRYQQNKEKVAERG